jgi:hypothetical protein
LIILETPGDHFHNLRLSKIAIAKTQTAIMSDDELFYLQPGFDLNSLTVPRLREILVRHDIAYTGSAKKPQLIQIVTDDLLPRSKKLLAQRARTKRTSKGITDVPSSQESTVSDDDAELMPPPKTPRSRKSKSNISGSDGATETPATTRRSRTPGTRKSTAKHPRQSDTETDVEKPQASARKTRKSVPGPTPVRHATAVQIEEPERRVKRESIEAGESPFSDDNPFQSGSSPSNDYRRVSSTSRTRKSLGTSADRRKSGSRRRSSKLPTDLKQEDGITAPSRSTFEFPVSRLASEPASDGVDATEEFTSEEAQELQVSRAASGKLVRTPGGTLVRRTKKKKPAGTIAKTAPWVIITALVGAVGGWYRNEVVNIGYCGVGQARWSLAENTHIPPWIHENLEPECLPCPQHAICFPDMVVTCENDYVLKPNLLSVGGILPFPPICEADGEKARRIRVVADRAVETLRDKRAVYECGEEVTSIREDGPAMEEVKPVVKAGEVKLEIPEEDLKAEVSKMRRKGMSADEFDDLWRSALGEIIDRDEVEVVRDG